MSDVESCDFAKQIWIGRIASINLCQGKYEFEPRQVSIGRKASSIFVTRKNGNSFTTEVLLLMQSVREVMGPVSPMRMSAKCVSEFYNLRQRLGSSKNNPCYCNILGEGSETVKNSDML
jgi:hypothetical protein